MHTLDVWLEARQRIRNGDTNCGQLDSGQSHLAGHGQGGDPLAGSRTCHPGGRLAMQALRIEAAFPRDDQGGSVDGRDKSGELQDHLDARPDGACGPSGTAEQHYAVTVQTSANTSRQLSLRRALCRFHGQQLNSMFTPCTGIGQLEPPPVTQALPWRAWCFPK
jgi:hypothetical protein